MLPENTSQVHSDGYSVYVTLAVPSHVVNWYKSYMPIIVLGRC